MRFHGGTEAVVYRQVQLLDLEGLLLRNTDADVGGVQQLSSAAAGQSDDGNAQRLSHFGGGMDIGGILNQGMQMRQQQQMQQQMQQAET